jgi:hypothetical protein
VVVEEEDMKVENMNNKGRKITIQFKKKKEEEGSNMVNKFIIITISLN